MSPWTKKQIRALAAQIDNETVNLAIFLKQSCYNSMLAYASLGSKLQKHHLQKYLAVNPFMGDEHVKSMQTGSLLSLA